MSDTIFSQVETVQQDYSTFDLSHNNLTTLKQGYLIPVFCKLTNPGDLWKVREQHLIRLQPFISPINSTLKATFHAFFVPHRLIWNNWQTFYTGNKETIRVNGKLEKGEIPSFPRFNPNNLPSVGFNQFFGSKSLYGYLGFPTFDYPQAPGYAPFDIDETPFRAYQLIYNEYFRDENLIDPIDIRSDIDGLTLYDGSPNNPISSGLFTLRKRAWKKDYFTSALPFAQQGEPVQIPLYGSASTLPSLLTIPEITTHFNFNPQTNTYKNIRGIIQDTKGNTSFELADAKNGIVQAHLDTEPPTPSYEILATGTKTTEDNPTVQQLSTFEDTAEIPSLSVDLSQVTAATITELRRAIAAQLFAESAARGGTRYIEFLKTMFDVTSSDKTLQRPQYLGSSSSPIIVSEILQTSQTTDDSPQGNPSGQGINISEGSFLDLYTEEVGWYIILLNVQPKADYFQGLPREFTKFDRLDYFFPQFQGIGEQEIKNKEIYFTPQDSSYSESTFGYTPRYAEYKTATNRINGEFRTNLQFWHQARIFSDKVYLNESFIESNPSDRIFALESVVSDPILANIHFEVQVQRHMSFYGTPKGLSI